MNQKGCKVKTLIGYINDVHMVTEDLISEQYKFKKVGSPIYQGRGFGSTGADWELYCNGKATGIIISNGKYTKIISKDGKRVAVKDTMEQAKSAAIKQYEDSIAYYLNNKL